MCSDQSGVLYVLNNILRTPSVGCIGVLKYFIDMSAVYTLEDVRKNDGKQSGSTWIVVKNNVYDVTSYMAEVCFVFRFAHLTKIMFKTLHRKKRGGLQLKIFLPLHKGLRTTGIGHLETPRSAFNKNF